MFYLYHLIDFVQINVRVFTIMLNFDCLQVHKIYRSTGASFAKAQQEFSTGVMRNEHVQSAAANAASGAAKGMASQYGSNNKY